MVNKLCTGHLICELRNVKLKLYLKKFQLVYSVLIKI